MSQLQQPKLNRLYQRLWEALHEGHEVIIKANCGRFHGQVVYLDYEFVEITSLTIYETEEGELTEDSCFRTVWLIKLSEIVAVAQSTQAWSREALEQLLDSVGGRQGDSEG